MIRSLLAPIYCRLIKAIAYGPWGPIVHGVLIRIFKSLYGISYSGEKKFATLGDFFLRDSSFQSDSSELVSPVEALVFEGPLQLPSSRTISVKNIEYAWSEFPELTGSPLLKRSTAWNLYLAPYHYHWVHAPSSGEMLEAMHVSGAAYPVNALGRRLNPRLYVENERVSFRWRHPQMGEIVMMCVGAMGVSGLYCPLSNSIPERKWGALTPTVRKGDKLLAFQLGSTVILLIENVNQPKELPNSIKLGESLC